MTTPSVVNQSFIIRSLSLAVITASLAACGGGGGGGSSDSSSPTPTPTPNDTQVSVTVDKDTGVTETTEKDDETTSTVVTTPPVDKDMVDTPAVAPTPPVNNPNTEVKLDESELAVFNRLNTRRSSCGFGALTVDAELNQAAKNHANYLLYMSKNSTSSFQGHSETQVDNYSGIKNPYYTGQKVENRVITGSSIGTKAMPVNYSYETLAENLSYLSFNDAYLNKLGDTNIALSGINGLLAAPYHMASLLEPALEDIGLSYGRTDLKTPLQLSDGSVVPGQGSVLEMVMGTTFGNKLKQPSEVLSYPCDGITGTQYELKHESPNPFGTVNDRNLALNPIGQPVYILGNGKLTVTNAKMTDAANKPIALKALTASNDPHKLLSDNQVILMPLTALKPNQSYRVRYTVAVDGGVAQNKDFTFKTKPAA